jgi:hypothetical protein
MGTGLEGSQGIIEGEQRKEVGCFAGNGGNWIGGVKRLSGSPLAEFPRLLRALFPLKKAPTLRKFPNSNIA